MIRSAVIIGSGNLAESLARALAGAGVLRQLYARNTVRATEIGTSTGIPWTDDPAGIVAADAYLIAVSDSAVGVVAEALPLPAAAIVAHTAGSLPVDAIPADKYPRRAAFYPFQTFTKGREVDFGAIPVFVEGSDEEVTREVEELAGHISRRVYRADSECRRLVHLSGVFANNFSNAMYGIGEQIARRAGLSFDVLRALVEETAAKAVSADHPSDVQTGPAVRGDWGVQQAHLRLLEEEPELQSLYELISERIWQISKRRS